MKMEKTPYRSVKEAVEMYGQRILAPELYANVLSEMESEENKHEDNLLRIKNVRDELDVAKQNLEKAKERSVAMTRSLSSLQDELEETKRKLQMLKEISDYDHKFVGDSWECDFKTQSQRFEEEEEESEVDEKRHVIVDAKMDGERFKNSPSMKKKKASKKKSIFFIGGFFSKRK